jgi:hypothetical protein
MMKQSGSWKCQHENDGLSKYGGRDVVGYGGHPPAPKWPGNAKVALNIVLNYEEGGENCLLHGDEKSENLLSEIVGAEAYGKRYPVALSADCSLMKLELTGDIVSGRTQSEHGKSL